MLESNSEAYLGFSLHQNGVLLGVRELLSVVNYCHKNFHQ